MRHPMATDEEFERYVGQVTEAMGRMALPTITPLANREVSGENEKVLKGTGSFVAVDGICMLLTCKHVTDKGTDFGFRGADFFHHLNLEVLDGGSRLDAAMMSIPTTLWQDTSHSGELISFDTFAEKHEPVEQEILFVCGFSGENSNFVMGEFFANSSGYSTQINEDAAAVAAQDLTQEDRYFYLLWEPEKVRTAPGTTERAAKTVKFEDAEGLSGSLVWDTGFVRAWREKRDWTPVDARVTGLLTRWDQKEKVLVARRIEDVRAWMADVLQNGKGAPAA